MSLPRDTDAEDSSTAIPVVSISGDDAPVSRPPVLPPKDDDGGVTSRAAIVGDGTDNRLGGDADDLEAEDALNEVFVNREGAVVPMDVICIVIYASVRILPRGVFDGRRQLKEVVLHEGLQEIGECAFYGCISLESIHCPSTLVRIGRGAFWGCTSLKEVKFLEGLLEIGAAAFIGCESLKEMKFPSTVATIGHDTFNSCSSLHEAVLPEGIQELGVGAFRGCISLRDVVVPEGIQELEDYAFSRCLSLERVEIPSTLRKIGHGAFFGCISLKAAKLREGLQEIGYRAFEMCISMLRINIPSSVSEIGRHAFEECTLLRNLAISSSLTQDMLEEITFLRAAGFSLGMLIGRFNGLPIHAAVYFYQPTGTDSWRQVKQKVLMHGTSALDFQDCLGMTPLHILACGGAPEIELYRFLIETCPEALTTEDRWGQIPLNYVLLSEAPLDIINLLLDTHRTMWGQLPFDFGDVVQRLAEKGTSGEFIQRVIRAQRKYFPDLEVDWGRVVDEADWGGIDAAHADAASRKILLMPYRALVEASVTTRTNCMSLKHKINVDNRIDAMGRLRWREEAAEERVQLRQLITDHAQSYTEYLAKVTAIFELALPDAVANIVSFLS